MNVRIALGIITLSACCITHAALKTKPEVFDKTAWEQPQKSFRIYGNTYYVGSKGLSAILIASPDGEILIDGTLAKNAPMIEANIRALGFKLKDIKLILNSHAHSDHAGGIAAIARDSGAPVAASVKGAKAIMLGGDDPDDPQHGDAPLYPKVDSVRSVADNETVHVGSLAVQAHYTPGHTPGSTTWTWTSCEGKRCLSMVYADSLSLLSADGYRYNDPAHPERLDAFRQALKTIAALPCDILMVPHQDAIDFLTRAMRRRPGEKTDPLIDPQACKAYAATGQDNLEKRIAKEAAEAPAH
ncbi:subclass B3 metallo-beta-lactamase [Rhodanobacter sp. MP1X3]|uniref:subclass B3 metallo-beta-lactamase n=1 Tax=Rhodanobacter sp. MP1X3 TaxID=2723086 RepID=UPI00161730D9|nr:subclass B3 metallo-beta-lactamase [Rhodanobacter sp. MP1X3]MBB6241802.1 metallo-beta-lactamase class B [Rhodanobacter sp. MP1X3]